MKRNQTVSLSLATTIIVYLFVKRVSEVWKDTEISARPNDDGLGFLRRAAQNISSPQEDESTNDDPCVFYLMEHVDSSVACMDQEWLCDEYADSSDIICKWYKSQTQNLVADNCLLPNATELGFQNGGYPVPRIVYYVAFGLSRLSFIQYLSLLSAKRFIKPWAMYVVGDVHLTGAWWQTATTDLGVRFIQRERPEWLADMKIASTELAGHLIRLQLLMVNGGIYLDLDMLLLRPLDPLLRYDVTLGHHDNDRGLNNAVILAKKHAPFIEKWYTNYNDFNDDDFTTLSEITLRQLSNEHPSSVHMETRNFLFPDKAQMRVLSINHSYDWRGNYGIHLPWHREFRLPTNPDGINKMRNCTLRQILKYVHSEKGVVLSSP
ncbi:uncharacterized protein LOC124259896 [Haliotis rubra]|uniref:uncharacterized protein LOC124259896 n=1 Tax=Haliotis rubra TaxID=36100 RepID=UPI001EE52B66|nr:uncharacterized protein LOC124259896 [Haliotis rubra]